MMVPGIYPDNKKTALIMPLVTILPGYCYPAAASRALATFNQ